MASRKPPCTLKVIASNPYILTAFLFLAQQQQQQNHRSIDRSDRIETRMWSGSSTTSPPEDFSHSSTQIHSYMEWMNAGFLQSINVFSEADLRVSSLLSECEWLSHWGKRGARCQWRQSEREEGRAGLCRSSSSWRPPEVSTTSLPTGPHTPATGSPAQSYFIKFVFSFHYFSTTVSRLFIGCWKGYIRAVERVSHSSVMMGPLFLTKRTIILCLITTL